MDLFRLQNTMDNLLDGTKVFITGVAYDAYPMPGTSYIIEREDGESFYTRKGYYKNILMTESCMEKVDKED